MTDGYWKFYDWWLLKTLWLMVTKEGQTIKQESLWKK